MAISRRFFLLSGAALASTPAVEAAQAATGTTPAASEKTASLAHIAPPRPPQAELSHGLFSRHLNRTFRAHHDAQNLRQELTLVSARAASRRSKSRASQADAQTETGQFSLVFRGPLDAPLPQEVYTVELPDVGAWTLLLVPVHHRDTTSRYYEVVVNRA